MAFTIVLEVDITELRTSIPRRCPLQHIGRTFDVQVRHIPRDFRTYSEDAAGCSTVAQAGRPHDAGIILHRRLCLVFAFSAEVICKTYSILQKGFGRHCEHRSNDSTLTRALTPVGHYVVGSKSSFQLETFICGGKS